MEQRLATGPRAWLLRLNNLLTSPLFWCGFFALGAVARCRQLLFTQSYWYDEAFVVFVIQRHDFANLLGPQPYNVVCPPLYLWITRALYDLGGSGEILMRLPGFIAGLLALVLMIPLARRTVRSQQAIWAFAFLAVSRRALFHSTEVHPYALDLLVTEIVLFCSLFVINPESSVRARRWAMLGLGGVALLGPWLSFPAAFVFGAASAALALHLWQHGSRRGWFAWVGFNAAVAGSGALLWWFSARHLYYAGMIEHWGPHGWRGFPDWTSLTASGAWLLERPLEVGDYATHKMGLFLSVLAIAGALDLGRRSRPLLVLVLGPFVLAVVAALIGKYPLAQRTTFFLAPCVWLLAAAGIGWLVRWGQARRWQLAFVGLLLIGWDWGLSVYRIARPDEGTDYRGAYQFVDANRRPDDLLWSQTAVVHEVYYGLDVPLLKDEDLDQAVGLAATQRLWIVVGENRDDLRQRIEARGAEVVLRHHVHGLDVLLFQPQATGD